MFNKGAENVDGVLGNAGPVIVHMGFVWLFNFFKEDLDEGFLYIFLHCLFIDKNFPLISSIAYGDSCHVLGEDWALWLELDVL